jgi:hypothetical protein
MNYFCIYLLTSPLCSVLDFSYNEILSVTIKADLFEVLFFGTLNNSSLSTSMFNPFKHKLYIYIYVYYTPISNFRQNNLCFQYQVQPVSGLILFRGKIAVYFDHNETH